MRSCTLWESLKGVRLSWFCALLSETSCLAQIKKNIRLNNGQSPVLTSVILLEVDREMPGSLSASHAETAASLAE